jgi:hypothetical protein
VAARAFEFENDMTIEDFDENDARVLARSDEGLMYKLLDRADGVKGHYCVGRQVERGGRFWEFYNKGRWESAGEVFTDREAAKAILELWAGRDELRQALDGLLQRRGRDILDFVRKRDREAAYQVGMLLGDVARLFNVNDPAMPPVELSKPKPILITRIAYPESNARPSEQT